MRRLILVEWWDATMEGGWVENEDAASCDEEPVCVTVGFVTAENKDWIKLAQTDGENVKGNIAKIPKRWIRAIQDLEH
jgi:hypothetical protein